MNSATRIATLNGLSVGKSNSVQAVRFGLGVWVLIAVLLTSAFSVVYVKDLSRRLFIRYQSMQHSAQKQQVEWGRLLLEQSTWASQARVQTMAQKQAMVTPSAKAIVMVEIK